MKVLNLGFVLLLFTFKLGACSNSNADETSAENPKDENNRWTDIQEAGEIVVGTSCTLIAASYYD